MEKNMMNKMIRKSLGMIIAALFLFRPGYCETKKISSLEEWYKWPFIFHIDEQKVCVIDKNLKSVVLYSRKDYRPLIQFGRPGQGPGEFSIILQTYVSPESIMITTSERISIFSHQGKLLEEIKNPQLYPIIKLENGFFQKRYQGEIITYEILDNKFKRKKELYSTRLEHLPIDPKTNKRIANLVYHHKHGLVTQHNIVIGDTEKGFYFKIFDHKGRLIREISHQVDRRRVNAEDKKMLMDELIERAKKSRRWELLKSKVNYIFSKYFPAYFDFFVQDEKLYVFGYPMPNKKQNVSIFDLKGELLSSKIIPYIGGNYFRHQMYFIYKGSLYYLFDNEESEKWELRAAKIE
jgi:hypothetical protein